MPVADVHLDHLTETECRSLLAACAFGRVAITVGALPAILPVNYGLLDDDIVFRTDDGPKLRAALDRAVVAFEIDGTDDEAQSGWSVLVVGHATALWRITDLERARALDLWPWAPGSLDHFVQLTTGMISGRRITHAEVQQRDKPG